MASARRWIAIAALATLPVACGLFIGLEAPEGKALPPLPEAGALGADECLHTGPPGPPLKEDDAGANLPPFWMVIRRTYVGDSVKNPDAGLPGFDLDGVCTCESRRPTAFDAGPSCIPRGQAKVQCDGNGGVDNEFERIVASYSGVFDLNGFTQRIDEGRAAIMVYIAEYNGQLNDRVVTVGFATADGLRISDCDEKLVINGNPPATANGSYFKPSWKGCDKWHGANDQILGNPTVLGSFVPKNLGKGYVKDGVLVLKGEVDVPIFFNDTIAQIQDPIFTAPLKRVEPMNGGPVRFRMENALLTGRMPLSYLAQIVFRANYDGFFMCKNLGAFKGIMDSFCAGIDSTESTALDFQGKVCQSMSFGFRFDTEVADLDSEQRAPEKDSPNPCVELELPPLNTICPPTQ